jgi:hypothetical protein
VTDDDVVFEHLVFLLIPTDGGAFEDQRGHGGLRLIRNSPPGFRGRLAGAQE